MNRKLLLESCKTLAAAGVWCIPESTLSACAGYPDKLYLRVALTRHVNAGLIERLGPKLYSNPFLKAPSSALFRLTNFLRPADSFYLSCESILSEHGWISQLPFCLTFVTTGRSYRYSTLLGDIDFVHTEEDPDCWVGHLQRNEDRQVWEASPEKALTDLRRYKRNLDLVLSDSERP
ncbi:type IV toxin-antitoxin system AbiEi family antitoxin [Pseudomonas proteolytica]|uniref:type IV toxin-antitoxin system AbiEi family antitoxin n=1 Tax=Pseudomonas proteolytica TaxID=219574 RepID=UPI0030D7A722